MIIKVSKEFQKEFSQIINSFPSMSRKVLQLRDDLQSFGISHSLFQQYDIKSLGDGWYRVKFVPIRVILFVEGDIIYLEKIFKRKGDSDYKFHK